MCAAGRGVMAPGVPTGRQSGAAELLMDSHGTPRRDGQGRRGTRASGASVLAPAPRPALPAEQSPTAAAARPAARSGDGPAPLIVRGPPDLHERLVDGHGPQGEQTAATLSLCAWRRQREKGWDGQPGKWRQRHKTRTLRLLQQREVADASGAAPEGVVEQVEPVEAEVACALPQKE